MTRTTLLWIVLGLWLLVMGLSATAFWAEPTGDGFTRGLNRVTAFFGWQLGAFLLAVVAWITVSPLPRGGLTRWLGRVPLWWTLALVLGMVGIVVYAMIADPGAGGYVPPGPVTAPAADAVPVE
ncbi:hypothetical protein HKCCE4037_07825 [Rhodobacterales bacterium HKCCE4037]|nr:hypothetical protein [Rhodobacterales bacterium HKCCE4037]